MTDAPHKIYSKAVVTIPGYSYLHQQSGKVSIAFRNHTSMSITILPKIAIAVISTANVVPPMLAPKVAVQSATVDISDPASAESKSDTKGSQRPCARPKLPLRNVRTLQ